jgi:PiT family inorganic phosphate transporter
VLRVISDLLAGATAGNNSTLIVSSLRRGGVMSRATASLYVALFMSLGVLVEGGKVAGAFSTAFALEDILGPLLLVSALVMVMLTLLRVPVSASQVVVSVALGLSVFSYTADIAYVCVVVISWLTTFGVSFAAGYAMWRMATALVRRRASPYFTLHLFMLLALASTALLSYVLGANTIALFISLGATPLEAQVSAVVGVVTVSAFLRAGPGRIASLDPYLIAVSFLSAAAVVEGYTQMGVPVSIMQAVMGATLGAARSARRPVNVGNIKRIIFVWVLIPPICTVVGFAVRAAFLTL